MANHKKSVTNTTDEATKALIVKNRIALLNTPEFSALSSSLSGGINYKEELQDFFKKAEAEGVPKSELTFGQDRSWGSSIRYLGISGLIAESQGDTRLLKELCAQGCNPWLKFTQVYAGAVTDELMSDEDMATYTMDGENYMFGHSTVTARKLILKSALLESWYEHISVSFFKKLFKSYSDRVEGSSKTAKGILGKGDRIANDSVSVILSAEHELMSAAAYVDKAAGAQSKPNTKIVMQLISDAKERWEAKRDQTAVVNPEKLRKSLSTDDKDRLHALAVIADKFPNRKDIFTLALTTIPRVETEPFLTSISPGNGGLSILEAAIRGANVDALEILEEKGANIWLAAAQSGNGNACDWLCSKLQNWDETKNVDVLAKLLLRGAWLEGAENPKQQCQERLNKLLLKQAKDIHYRYGAAVKSAIQRLCVSFEREALDDFLKELSFPQSAEVEKTNTPRKRASL